METFERMNHPGRAERFTELYLREHSRLLGFVYRRVGDRGTAEELTAEAFRIAWERTADGSAGTPAQLFVTARNLLANHHRATARLGELHRRIRVEVDRSTDSEQESTVVDALERLPGHHRDVLLMTYWDGLSAAETGAVLGCRAPAVWVRLHRARKAFRDLYTQSATTPEEK
ncbi:RNA polymerase sigma factor [Streptomyces katsurahamanus]|uniref:Sigma-70 family RNA polymerase sigma factor n=1 Tax=Streptomyces katsurahamanus TaxID=2577098 RepID=A0ABW9NWQ4_9ACTN|nr:sigma-70 family RNA polymerase sigma factor [Streptomyces katsurahamanus]MQS37722.1 sigma-70 family RNA polymerase sigma factor [Streptomyces katsurahamanus]